MDENEVHYEREFARAAGVPTPLGIGDALSSFDWDLFYEFFPDERPGLENAPSTYRSETRWKTQDPSGEQCA